MAAYYVNKYAQADGDHEVHRQGCSLMPAAANRLYLGDFESCVPAIKRAKATYEYCDGCYYCSSYCHTRNKPSAANDISGEWYVKKRPAAL